MKTGGAFRIDFLVPGFSKCGTTTLCALLAEHPQIYIPPGLGKEPLFFIREDPERHLPAYRDLFAPAGETQLLGEGSTFYSAHQHDRAARDRIHAHNPDMRMIWIARDPLRRIESSFREFLHSGHLYGVDVPPELDAALARIPALILDSSFWARISTYRERFPDTQMLVLFQEDLHTDPRAVLARCYEFLGVDPGYRNPDPGVRMNVGEAKFRDTRLMRALRGIRPLGRPLAALHHAGRDRLLQRLGLRQPLGASIDWSERAQQQVIDGLLDDALAFLAHAGRDISMWPRLASAARGRGAID